MWLRFRIIMLGLWLALAESLDFLGARHDIRELFVPIILNGNWGRFTNNSGACGPFHEKSSRPIRWNPGNQIGRPFPVLRRQRIGVPGRAFDFADVGFLDSSPGAISTILRIVAASNGFVMSPFIPGANFVGMQSRTCHHD